jgi:hypothetical protein
VEARRVIEVRFRDGLCETERAFGWHGFVPLEQCWRMIRYGPRGTPRRIAFPGEEGRSEIVIGESGFAVRRDVVAADATVKSVEYPTPFTSVELRDDGNEGRTYEVTLGRNALMQYPAYFALEVTLTGDGKVANISGTMFECEWGEYGYFERYGPDDTSKLFASVRKKSGLSRQEFLEALNGRLEAASSPGPQ